MSIEIRPLVSIGIPSYNRPKQLRRVLASITTQTYSNFEVLVSDNCSPGTVIQEVVEEFMAKDSRIRYIRQPSNVGMFYNFKRVFEMAKGDYFAWLADDDVRADTFIERCMEVFEQPNQSPDLILVNAYSQAIPSSLRDTVSRKNGKSDFENLEQRLTSGGLEDYPAASEHRSMTQTMTKQTSSDTAMQSIKTDQGCTTIGMPAAERYYRYLGSVYTTQNAIGDLIYGVMKRKAIMPVLMSQPNILGWDRVFLAALALEGEFYTIPEVLMYSSLDGMSSLKNVQKMAAIQCIENPLYIRKAKWVRAFFLQQAAWYSQSLSILAKLKLTLWLWTNTIKRAIFQQPA